MTQGLFRFFPPEIDETIADAALGEDIFGVGWVFFQLLAQIIDVKPHVMRLVAIFVSPDLGKKLIVGHHPTGILHQVVQQPVFGRAQLDLLVLNPHLTPAEINFEPVIHLDHIPGGRRWRLVAAQHGLNPADQLARAERLGDVIIRAQLQAADPVIFFALWRSA